MNGPEYRELGAAEFATVYASTSIPTWARSYRLRREPDGRPTLSGELDGCYVWIQPKAWSKVIISGESPAGESAGTLNFGLQMGSLQAHAGQIETNDPSFGREVLGARTGSECPMPDPSQGQANTSYYGAAAVIFAVGMVLAAFVAALKRRAS